MIAYPKVTIAIPVYNGADYLGIAIDSALGQTYGNVEVIVVNDGSTDGGSTEAIAHKYSSKIKYIAQENKGVAGAMNTAITHMTGDFFTWLSHDDIHLPEKVEVQLEYFNMIGREDIILFSDFYLIDEQGEILHETKLPYNTLVKTPMLPLLRGHINGCTLFIPVHILREFGPFDENLRYVQDYDLWNKILSRYEFLLQPRPLIKYRIHPAQGTKRPEAAVEGDALWIRMVDARCETERVQLSGSAQRFLEEMADFLDRTPYKRAAEDVRGRIATVISETRVSIVIPFHNHVEQVLQAAHSVLNQTHHRLELILVDDGSTEDLARLKALVEADCRVRLLRQPQLGLGTARNRGMDAAGGSYIALLNADDLFVPCKLESQLGAMQRAGWVFSYTGYMGPSPTAGIHEQPIDDSKLNGNVYPAIIYTSPIGFSTVMMHRSLLDGGISFEADDLDRGSLAWIWVALRHPIHRISTPLAIVRGQELPDARLESRKFILQSLQSDPSHSRQTEALRKFHEAIAADEAEATQRRLKAGEALLEEAGAFIAEGKTENALEAVRRARATSKARDILLQAAIYLQILRQYNESLEAFMEVIAKYGAEGLWSALGVANALAGQVDDAIAMFRAQLRRFPEDNVTTYHLASCLAFQRRFKEADTLFSRRVDIALGNGGYTNTAIIDFAWSIAPTFSPPTLNSVPPNRRVLLDGMNATEMREVELVYFVSCDTAYAKLFLPAVVRSLDENAGLRLGVHLHLVNPDRECRRLVEDLRDGSRLPIAISQETFDWPDAPEQTRRTYYSVSRFLVLPEILRLYDKPVLIADADQLVVKSLVELVRLIEKYDAGLLMFSDQSFNLLSLFSASIMLVQPTQQGHVFVERMRRYLFEQLYRLKDALPWHLDQAALAVSTLTASSLRWCPIPSQWLQSDTHQKNPDNDIRDETVFWSVTYSIGENSKKLDSSKFRNYVNRLSGKGLFVCFPYSIHAARWLSLVQDTGLDRHVFPSVPANDLHAAFQDITFWPIPEAPMPALEGAEVRFGSLSSTSVSVADRSELASYLAKVIERERFDFVHTMEFQHAGYLLLDALDRVKGPAPTWIATNYGSDIFLFGKQPEHETLIRRILERCDYYWSECQRDIDIARGLGLAAQVLPVVPNSTGIDLDEVAGLRAAGRTSERRIIAIKGYQHFAGRALTALRAIELCRDNLSGYELKVFAPSVEVREAVERLQSDGLRISCLADWVPHREILSLHGSARTSIAVSISDGISTALLEAMAMGSFPIQTSTACACEWIEDGKTGFIIEPDDPAVIAQRITAALHDDELVDRAAEQNWQRIAANASVGQIRQIVRRAYSEILHQ